MIWLALHLPALPLQAWAATLGPPAQAGPLALLEGSALVAVNAAAAAAGVQPGMRRATALALAPQLVFGRTDPARDAQALRSVAHAALAFTPAVTLQGADTVLLEVASTVRLFGGLEALRHRLRDSLAPLGLDSREACAPTALGAAALAGAFREASADVVARAVPGGDSSFPAPQPPLTLTALRAALDALPVERLVALAGGAHEQAASLQGMGVHTVAQLRALPRAGLARRFGPALLQALDRARGEAPDPRDWLPLPETFEEQLELHTRADTSGQLLGAAGLLLARLVTWARARRARVQRCELLMQHERRHRSEPDTPALTRLELALVEASDDAAHLQGLLRERLAALQLPAPTLQLGLRCAELDFTAQPSGELFPVRGATHASAVRLLERLQARLGPQGVQALRTVADHRPERATMLAPLGAAPPPASRARAAGPAAALTRPAWLLPEPQPLPERGSHPLLEGRPLQLLAGPERIEAGWWEGPAVLRDYFVAQAHDGALVWVYRTRLPRAGEPAGWFLHGRFA